MCRRQNPLQIVKIAGIPIEFLRLGRMNEMMADVTHCPAILKPIPDKGRNSLMYILNIEPLAIANAEKNTQAEVSESGLFFVQIPIAIPIMPRLFPTKAAL